jgi:hypothetical protein
MVLSRQIKGRLEMVGNKEFDIAIILEDAWGSIRVVKIIHSFNTDGNVSKKEFKELWNEDLKEELIPKLKKALYKELSSN